MADPTPDQGNAPVPEPSLAPTPSPATPSPEPVTDSSGVMAYLDREEAQALAEARAAGLAVDDEELPAAAPQSPAAAPPAQPTTADQAAAPTATQQPPAAAGPPEMVPYQALAASRRQLSEERAAREAERDRLLRENIYLRGLHDGTARAPGHAQAPAAPPSKHPIAVLDEQIAAIDVAVSAEKDALAKQYEDGSINFVDFNKKAKAVDDQRAKQVRPLSDRRQLMMAEVIADRRIAQAAPQMAQAQQQVNPVAGSLALQEKTAQLQALEPWINAVPDDQWHRPAFREEVIQKAASLGWSIDPRTEEGVLNYRLAAIGVAKEMGWNFRFSATTAAPNAQPGSVTPQSTAAPSAQVPQTRFPPSLAAGVGRGKAVTDGNAAEQVARMSIYEAEKLSDAALDAIAPMA